MNLLLAVIVEIISENGYIHLSEKTDCKHKKWNHSLHEKSD